MERCADLSSKNSIRKSFWERGGALPIRWISVTCHRRWQWRGEDNESLNRRHEIVLQLSSHRMNGVFIPSAIARVSVLVWPSPPPPLHLSRPLGVLWSRSEADGLQTRRSIQLSPFASLGNLLFPQSSRLFVPRRLRSAPHHRSASLSANRREPGQRWRAPRDAGPVASPLVSSKRG